MAFRSFRLSTDGRYIVYENYDGNIYLRDRGLSTTITVTVGYDGSPANDKSLDPVISPDGRFVVFSSEAYNLVEAPVSWGDDIYLYDTTTGRTSLVSVTYDGNPGNGKSGGIPRSQRMAVMCGLRFQQHQSHCERHELQHGRLRARPDSR